MDSSDKFWLGFWMCIALSIIGIAWSIAYTKTVVEIQAIRAGLIQVEYTNRQLTGLKWVPKK